MSAYTPRRVDTAKYRETLRRYNLRIRKPHIKVSQDDLRDLLEAYDRPMDLLK